MRWPRMTMLTFSGSGGNPTRLNNRLIRGGVEWQIPGMAKLYRQKVTDLAQALEHPRHAHRTGFRLN